LPLVAPLLDFAGPKTDANWYLRVFDPGQHLRGADEVAKLCARNESLARQLLEGAWSDAAFVTGYAHWTIDILEGQKHYHHRVGVRQHALQHRVHRLTTGLFGLTALGALSHLLVHSLWLSLVTTFFPALGASLHGGLAQSEAYRLGVTAERLIVDLQGAIDEIRASLAADAPAIRGAVLASLALILEEHQDWHMLVRPHHLPLA